MKITDAAAWKKPTKNGGQYLSVRITFEDGSSAWINLFDNRYKTTDRHPDMKVIKEKSDEARKENNFDEMDKIPF